MSRASRIAAGIICMLAAGWIVHDYMDGGTLWEPILTFVASFATWAFAEFKADSSPNMPEILHPHDVTLGQKLRNLFNEQTKIFLREHSFGQPYPHLRLHPVRDVSYWQGAEYEFDNSELDNICSEIVRLSNELYTKLSEYAGPINRPDGYFAVPLDHERAQDRFGEETTAHIAELNALSRKISTQLENFEKAFRRLSPDSYRAGAT